MKSIFFKTVRTDGTSVWTKGKLAIKYEVGHRYTFPKELPAHCFWMDPNHINSKSIYENRAVSDGGHRVLICYGEVKPKDVLYMSLGQTTWDFRALDKGKTPPNAWRSGVNDIYTSYDFEVIGEIKPQALTYNELPRITGARRVLMTPRQRQQLTVEPTTKKLFFKTVREDYSSVYAKGDLCRKYIIGTRHQFPKELPAHVFGMQHAKSLNNEFTFKVRPESSSGNRVMVCYGQFETKLVPVLDICPNYKWILMGPNCWQEEVATRDTSTDFEVIGELALPAEYNGQRPKEDNYGKGNEEQAMLAPHLLKKLKSFPI